MGVSRNPNLLGRVRALRAAATREERRLWYDFLSSYPVPFRRQRPIGPYIADFYCPKARLVIELDGSQHYGPEGLARDADRTRYLEGLGLTVLRFANTELKTQFPAVCAAVDLAVKEANP